MPLVCDGLCLSDEKHAHHEWTNMGPKDKAYAVYLGESPSREAQEMLILPSISTKVRLATTKTLKCSTERPTPSSRCEPTSSAMMLSSNSGFDLEATWSSSMITGNTTREVAAGWLWRFALDPRWSTISSDNHWSSRRTGRLKRFATVSVMSEGPKAKFSML